MSHHRGMEVMGKRGGHPCAVTSLRGLVGTSWGDPGDALGRMLWAGCSSNPLLPHFKQFGWDGKWGVLHLGFGKDL